MLGTLTVPTGVELRGAADFGSIPVGTEPFLRYMPVKDSLLENHS